MMPTKKSYWEKFTIQINVRLSSAIGQNHSKMSFRINKKCWLYHKVHVAIKYDLIFIYY